MSHESILKYKYNDITFIILNLEIVSIIISKKIRSLIFLKTRPPYYLEWREYMLGIIIQVIDKSTKIKLYS